jgi:hypothetical protein
MQRRWGAGFSDGWRRWALALVGLALTGCTGALGVAAVAVVVSAGALGMTCYDHVSVTVTDQATGTELCDARVSFKQGSSVIEAKSCYEAALSRGSYVMHVERAGLVPYDVPFEVARGEHCNDSVQTIYVALERPGARPAPQMVVTTPLASAPAAAPAAATPASSASSVPAAATSPSTAAPSPAPPQSLPTPPPTAPAPGVSAPAPTPP